MSKLIIYTESVGIISSSNDPKTFDVPTEKVDLKLVPKKLYTGAEIQVIGMGTFGSDRFIVEDIENAVLGAAEIGFRHFDYASVYGNEDLWDF